MSYGKSDLVDVDVYLHHSTDGDTGAHKVSLDGDDKTAIWVPKSACEIERQNGSTVWVLTLREALAIDKGLI